MNVPQPYTRSEAIPVSAPSTDTPKATGLWQQIMDGLALLLAGACAIHCLLFPVFVVFFPLLGSSFANDHRFHTWMLAAVIPTTAIALFLGCRKHKDKWVIALSTIGLGFLTIGVLLELSGYPTSGHSHSAHDHAHAAEFNFTLVNWLAVIGGLFMATAHIRNFRNCRSENSNCHCDH